MIYIINGRSQVTYSYKCGSVHLKKQFKRSNSAQCRKILSTSKVHVGVIVESFAFTILLALRNLDKI